MCGPALGMMQGLIGGMGAIANYNAQVDDFNQREKQWQTNYKNALMSGRDEYNQLNTRAVEEQAATGQKIQSYAEEGAIKAAEAETAAAGAGVSGNSVDEVIRGILGGSARNIAYAKENARFTAQKIADQGRGITANVMNRINSLTRPVKPNAGAAMLNVAGAFLGGMG